MSELFVDDDGVLITMSTVMFPDWFLLDPPPGWRVDPEYGCTAGTLVIYQPENRIWRLTGRREKNGCCGDGRYEGKWPD